MRILFLGTPEFSVPSLKALVREGFDVIGVVTQPDRPSGRGHKLVASPLKQAAQELGLPVFQYEKIRDEASVQEMKALAPDIMVTAAYGQILSKKVLAIPPMGTVNVHGSLLPRYRGAAPIQWAVIDGLRETGVSTMITERGVDTGPVLLQQKMEIQPGETAGELSVRMAEVGAELLCRTLKELEAGTLEPTPQDPEQATQCPMLDKENGRIRWGGEARRIEAQVRGVNPWPGAFTYLDGTVMKIWKASVTEGAGTPGEVLSGTAGSGLIVACGKDALKIEVLQVPGKKAMPAVDFLRGRPIPAGTVLLEEESC